MIAFLDSGYGGKTIMSEVKKLLPEYDYMYLGDNFRAPYGNYSAEKICELSERAVEFLFQQGAVLIVVACNTICSVALRHLQEKYLRQPQATDRKILGIVLPIAERACELTKGRIGVIGTRTTINSNVYQIETAKINPEVEVFGQACPLLVPLIEENWHHKPESTMILKKYLMPLKSHNIDTLILGCTHYPFMLKQIQRKMGKNINIIDPGAIVAESLKDYLQRHPEIDSLLGKNGHRKYMTTDCSERFKKMIASLLGTQLTEVEQVNF